jgi:hypothetical protein
MPLRAVDFESTASANSAKRPSLIRFSGKGAEKPGLRCNPPHLPRVEIFTTIAGKRHSLCSRCGVAAEFS